MTREVTGARREHIETLERLGRLVVATARRQFRVRFVLLDAFNADAQAVMLAAA